MGDGEASQSQDDPEISSDDVVLRRIRPEWVDHDGRISSAAFDDTRDNAMSVYLRSRLRELGKEDDSILEGFENCGIAELRVGDIRAAGMGVRYDGNPPGHALVINLQRRRKSKADKKRLRDAARWVKRPPEMK